jgi:hypothetical protein
MAPVRQKVKKKQIIYLLFILISIIIQNVNPVSTLEPATLRRVDHTDSPSPTVLFPLDPVFSIFSILHAPFPIYDRT